MRLIAGMLLFVLLGCAPYGYDTYKDTITLNPSPALSWGRTMHSYPANDTYWPCSVESGGLAGEQPNPGEAIVGYDHFYDAGTQPFPCSKKLTHIYRAAMQFDLSKVAEHSPGVYVDQASLSFDRVPDPNHGRECDDTLIIPTLDWQVPGAKLPDGAFYRTVPHSGTSSCGLGGCSIEVTSIVRNWVNGTEPRFGLVLKGEDDSFPEDNNRCVNRYRDLKLTISYRWDIARLFPTDPPPSK